MATSLIKTLALPLALGSALALAGCGGGGDNVSRGDRNRLAEACNSSPTTSEEVCGCVADLARDELSPNTFYMVLANMEGDTERASELQGQMTMDEANEAAAFFFSAFAQCSNPSAAGNGGK
jgi:hypothetical protein